ncbi:MAG: hypothetical protein KDD62_07355 [Bdellovibrionales bacterium]|nr:hypothetical protein [Bdellovibrionales bacterium]
MTEVNGSAEKSKNSLAQATVRVRADQKYRLDAELRARGGTLADVIRDNLDLAFAIKEELSQIVQGDYDQNDPKNAPRLVHALLFRVEERILASLDDLAQRIDNKRFTTHSGENGNGQPLEPTALETTERFLSLAVDLDEHPIAVWIGAFLEIIPRLELVGEEQLKEIAVKGEKWLAEHT